jgi:predicted phosphohydrolase
MILRNSARCDRCGIEIESKHRHDFKTHYCKLAQRIAQKWARIDGKEVLVDMPGEITWNFAVDGGKSYIRRCGGGYTDTSEFADQEAI